MKSNNLKIMIELHKENIAFGSLYLKNMNREIEVQFDIEFDIDLRSFDGHSRFNRIDVEFKYFEIDKGAEFKPFFIKEQNIELLKKMCVDLINEDPESFGVDFEDSDLNWNNDQPSTMSTIYSGYPSRVNANKF
jgi:hypothetical protein